MSSVTYVTSVSWDMGTSTASLDANGEYSFFLQGLKTFSITQCNCMAIGLYSDKETNQPAVLHEPMAMKPARACQNGRGHLAI